MILSVLDVPQAKPESWHIWELESWGPWLSMRLMHAVLFLLGAFLLDLVWRLVLRRIVKIAAARDDTQHKDLERRVETLSLLLRRLGSSVVYIGAVLMILGDFGVAIGPLLAGLGIVGVAVGFGAQYLVKDLITGFFVVLEDQFRVGDSVKINEFSGTVEHMTLRITEIRGIAGEVHTVPNGDIRWVTNFSRGWSRAIVDVPVSRDVPLTEVMEALREAGRRLRADEKLGPLLLDEPESQGIVSMDGTSVTLRLWVKAQPRNRLDVERALRQEVLDVLEERFPGVSLSQRTILLQQTQQAEKGKP
jgi:small conductance mechanosensitive channel